MYCETYFEIIVIHKKKYLIMSTKMEERSFTTAFNCIGSYVCFEE